MKVIWDEIIKAVSGKPVYGRPEGFFSGISTDTRTIKAGELFIALKGENFDGHDFVEAALQKGACGAVVSSEFNPPQSPLKLRGEAKGGYFIVKVNDTLTALGDIARLWREKHPIPVIAITGSNGKTTTKEMAASVLSQRYKVLKTTGNLNNLIGLPQMVLKIKDSHEAAVLELGMSAFGEIRRLSEICQPDIALITNIGSGHLEGVGSIEGVSRAKGEILEGLKASGTFVVNADDPHIKEIAEGWHGKTVTFATRGVEDDVRTLIVDYSYGYCSGMSLSMVIGGKPLTIDLMGLGVHNVYNATAAAAVAYAMGLGHEDIKKGLEEWRPFKGRFELLRLEGGINLIDDTYNANPNSVSMAVETLAKVKGFGRGVAVLGDMLELGTHAEEAHYGIGKRVAALGLDYLFLMGPLSSTHTLRGAEDGGMAGERIITADSHRDTVRRISPILQAGDWVLVKGSRGMEMEKVVEGVKRFARRSMLKIRGNCRTLN